MNVNDYNELHVHHTWKPDHHTFEKAVALYGKPKAYEVLQMSMRTYHMTVRGFSDIAQHLTIFPDGHVMVGRPFGKDPASIQGKNEGAFMVEIVGNFDHGHDTLEGPQLREVRDLASRFVSAGKYVRFHRENSSKTCPGTTVTKEMIIGDVPAVHWAYEAIERVKDAGIMSGYPDGTFRPSKPVTRAELAAVVSKLLDRG